MTIKSDLEDGVVNKHLQRINAVAYSQGHWDAKVSAIEIVEKHDNYINRLEYYICKMAGGDILQEIKEECGYDC